MDDKKNLPPNWIKTESKSRPNTFYYFNTKTNESRWTYPITSPSPPKKKTTAKIIENIKTAENRVINAFKNGSKFLVFFFITFSYIINLCVISRS